MAVISDLAGTSHSSFSINGKNTIFQGDIVPPEPTLGQNGDLYLNKEGLFYIKREGVWEELTKDSVPDARTSDYHHRLLYSTGDIYDFAHVTYNDDGKKTLKLEHEPTEPQDSTSMVVPNIGWLEKDGKSNILHKEYNEEASGEKTLTGNGNGTLSSPIKIKNIGSSLFALDDYGNIYIKFFDNKDRQTAWIESLLNYNPSNSTHNDGTSVLRLGASTFINDDVEPTEENKIEASIDIYSIPNGQSYATAPETPLNANNQEIATAKWVKTYISQLENRIQQLENSTSGLPDWNNMVNLSGNSGTFNSYGWFFINRAGVQASAYINNIQVYTNTGGHKGQDANSIFIPVKPGDTWSVSNTSLNAKFVPSIIG